MTRLKTCMKLRITQSHGLCATRPGGLEFTNGDTPGVRLQWRDTSIGVALEKRIVRVVLDKGRGELAGRHGAHAAQTEPEQVQHRDSDHLAAGHSPADVAGNRDKRAVALL